MSRIGRKPINIPAGVDVKVSDGVVTVKGPKATLTQKVHPNMVRRVEINGHYVGDDTVVRVSQFFFLYMAFIVLWALLLTWDGVNIFDAVGISVSTMGCIGPAFGITGATCTYANLSDFAKSILCLSMLLGRLEILTLLVMCRRSFWKSKGMW